jgi:hypothetical protein
VCVYAPLGMYHWWVYRAFKLQVYGLHSSDSPFIMGFDMSAGLDCIGTLSVL